MISTLETPLEGVCIEMLDEELASVGFHFEGVGDDEMFILNISEMETIYRALGKALMIMKDKDIKSSENVVVGKFSTFVNGG